MPDLARSILSDPRATPAAKAAVRAAPAFRHVLAIDPGNKESAFLCYDCGNRKPVTFDKIANGELLEMLSSFRLAYPFGETPDQLVIEMIASYGMPVGREVFETCVWIGRFVQAWMVAQAGFDLPDLIYRKDIKLHLCGTTRAKDSNVRQSLLDRWGGREVALGRKAAPGPLYGISKDAWSALAVAVAFAEGGAA